MIAQTTKQDTKTAVNKAGASVVETTKAPGTPRQEAVSSDEVLVLPGISVVEQPKATERMENHPTVSPSRYRLFSRFVAQLSKLYVWLSGPMATELHRREATAAWANTRSKIEMLDL